MDNIFLEKRNSSETSQYAIGFAMVLIVELIIFTLVLRNWWGWEKTIVFLLGILLITSGLFCWKFFVPVAIPNILTDDTLTLRYGYKLKLPIPLERIDSISETDRQIPHIVGFGLKKAKSSSMLFALTGNKNKIIIHLNEPVEAKGLLRNYGYVEQIVFNIDQPYLLLGLVSKPTLAPREASSEILPVAINDRQGIIYNDSPVLVLENVSKFYSEMPAVRNLSLSFYPSEVFGLLGTNGAGKTTTLKMISGLLKPSGGNISSLFRDSNSIAYMPENIVIYERMSAREFLEFLGVLYKVDEQSLNEQIDLYLRRFDLINAADRPLGSFSQGMKRKVLLIGTLIKGSSIILLDEPTNGMDPTGIIEVKEFLKELARSGKTIIVSTHILEMAEKLCDRVCIIAGGILLFVGTLEELREKSEMEHASLEDIFIKLIQE